MEKNKRNFSGAARLFCVLALLLFVCAASGEEGLVYKRNEWNYVDGSMDVSGGIPASAIGRLAQIRKNGLLRVATEPYYPPQEFIDPSLSGQDQFVGADMELARLIARRMGVELEIVPMEFNQVLDSIAEGEYDLAISALSYTAQRAARMELSKGYYFTSAQAAAGILIRAEDADEISSVADLNGRDIVALSGSL